MQDAIGVPPSSTKKEEETKLEGSELKPDEAGNKNPSEDGEDEDLRGLLRGEMVERFTKIWSSQGTRTRMDVTFYRPLPSQGFHILGDIVRPYIADFPRESSFPVLALVRLSLAIFFIPDAPIFCIFL